jgi:tRNA nucleotidyltransferase/poly(A) polymerase
MPGRAFRLLLHHPGVRALVAACDVEGVACHLVGGVLRDHALGLPVHDVDAVVPERGRAVAERLAAALPARLVVLGGKEFAAFRAVAADFEIDLWDRAGMTFDEDLARRDFTVNSIALDARSGTVSDPFDGLGDLRRRVLRATTPESFTGDPLRVLRLPRLLLRLSGFAAEPATLELARRAAPLLPRVSSERVRDELSVLFAHPEAHRGLALLIALDLYPGLWLGAPGVPETSGHALAELEALEACVHELRELDAHAAEAVEAPAARFASLFANLPPRPGVAPEDDVERCRKSGYLTNRTAGDVHSLLALPDIPDDDLPARRWLHRAGALWSTAACWQGARRAARKRESAAWRIGLRRLTDLVARDREVLFDPPRLVTGTDVQELLGLRPGRELGNVLAAVQEAQVEGRVRTREEALAMVRSRS